MLGQDQADQIGAPLRVLLAQGLGLQDEGGLGVGTRGGSVIARRHRLAGGVGPALQQVVDGTQREVAAPGQDVGGQAGLVPIEDRLANRQGNGAWHGKTLQEKTCGRQGTPGL